MMNALMWLSPYGPLTLALSAYAAHRAWALHKLGRDKEGA